VTSRIEPIEPGDASDEAINELLKQTEQWYDDSAFVGVMAHQPELFKILVSVFESFGKTENIDSELLELMRLKVADCHQCAYCGTVRTQDVFDEVAPKEEAVFEDINADVLSDREVLAVQLAEYMSEDPHQITDEFMNEIRDEFGKQGAIELLLFLSIEVGLDRFCIALTLDTSEESPYTSGLEYPLENPSNNQ